MLSAAEVARINLIEVLQDAAEAEGRQVDPLPEDSHLWSDDDIRRHFTPHTLPRELAPLADLPAASSEEFARWFPGLKLSKTACAHPRWRVLCFPNAGNSEDMFTNEGTGIRQASSPLLEWCRMNQAECLAVQLPGRMSRIREQPITSAQEAASHLFPIIASSLAKTPYIVIAHSVGTWIAFELLALGRARGLRMPEACFFSAMAAPDMPPATWPWRKQCTLTEDDFKAECRAWDINEAVFTPAMWSTYQPLLRADFRLYDEYTFHHLGLQPFDFPMHTFYGERDRRITEAMVLQWSKFTRGPFTCRAIPGHHLWPADKGARGIWLARIVAELKALTETQTMAAAAATG